MDEYFVEERTKWDKLLDLLVFVAVFVVTIFLILELVAQTGKTTLDIVQINEIYYYINIVVFIIFLVDLIRLWYEHDGFKDFITHCWLDVLATIPFGLLVSGMAGIPATSPTFEVLKLLRFSKLTELGKMQRISRVSKISRQFKAASHLKKEGQEYTKKHRL